MDMRQFSCPRDRRAPPGGILTTLTSHIDMPRAFSLLLALSAFGLAACDSGDGLPRGVEIRQITIEDAPLFRPDGERWDGGLIPSGPDLYVRLLDARGNVLLDTDDEELNREPGGDGIGNYTDVGGDDFPLVWDIDPSFYLPGLDRVFEIEVRDDDPTSSDDVVEFTERFTFDGGDGRVGVDDDIRLRSASGETSVRIRFRLVD